VRRGWRVTGREGPCGAIGEPGAPWRGEPATTSRDFEREWPSSGDSGGHAERKLTLPEIQTRQGRTARGVRTLVLTPAMFGRLTLPRSCHLHPGQETAFFSAAPAPGFPGFRLHTPVERSRTGGRPWVHPQTRPVVQHRAIHDSRRRRPESRPGEQRIARSIRSLGPRSRWRWKIGKFRAGAVEPAGLFPGEHRAPPHKVGIRIGDE